MKKRINNKKENKYVDNKKKYTKFHFTVFLSPAVELKF